MELVAKLLQAIQTAFITHAGKMEKKENSSYMQEKTNLKAI